MYILGISAFYHDSAAALVDDKGLIIAAAQEERFTRKKHDSDFPTQAVNYCLKEAGITLKDVAQIVFYDKPFIKFERLLETYLAYAPTGFSSFKIALPVWVKEKLFLKKLINKSLKKIDKSQDYYEKLLFSEHHLSHAASAYYASPYDEAVILTLDGVGEWATTSVGIGKGSKIEIVKEMHFPHSLGLLYSAFTYYTGFKVNSGEYKLMGLAPYGQPTYYDVIMDKLVDVKSDGSFCLNLDYFTYMTGTRMTGKKFDDLFGGPARTPDQLLTQKHMDLAASIQKVTEEIMLRMTRALYQEYKIDNLCLAGGVALNCVANGKILKDNAFKNIWIQPAAGDAGGALGAALAVAYLYHQAPKEKSKSDKMRGSYLGPAFSDAEIAARLKTAGAKFEQKDEKAVIDETAQALADGKAIGWFQGRMEYGPRALGNRSILGDPRSPSMQKNLNLKTKFRESFRPFAPSVLREDLPQWFDIDADSPYMLLVAPINDNKKRAMTDAEEKLFGIDKLNIVRSEIPAVTHVDYSARVQTIHQETNPQYHALITQFKKLTGCPVIVNTSFNVRGEPIVCTPEDAFRCFMGTNLDVLVVGNTILKKEDQDMTLAQDYKNAFELD